MEDQARREDDSGASRQARRFGMVIGIKPDRIEEYKRLHAGPGVRDLLRKANIRNFSIFLQRFDDGKHYEFAYYEYVGADHEADMAWLASQPENKEWLALCDPMQIPLAGQAGWTLMPSIYHNE